MKRKFLSFLAAGMLFTLPAAAQSVGVVMSGGGPYRRIAGTRRERHSDRLRVGNLDGFDHRGHVRRRILPRRDAPDRRFGCGQTVGFGAHRPQLPALLPPQYRHPDLPLDPPQHEGPPGRPQREPFPPAFVPDLLESDRPGPRRPVRPGHDSFPAGLRQPDGAVPLRGERYEHPPSGGAAQGRHGRSDPFVDVHSAGVQTHENRHDATLRRRHLRQLPLGTPRQGVPSRFPDRQQMHVGKQRHHGEQFARRSSLLAGHEQDQLRHARRTQSDDQPGCQCQHARFQQRRFDHRSGLPRRTGPDSGPAGKNPPHRHARRDPHQAGGFPRKMSPDHLRRLRVRRTHPCTNGLCT